MRKQRWRAAGEIGAIDALLADAADWPFDVALTTDGARIAAKGQLLHATTPRAARASVNAKLDKPAALAGWVDDAARVPLPIELKSTLDVAGGTLRADPLALSVAGQAIAGRATWHAGDPWKLDAKLDAGRIDLAAMLPARAARGAAPAASRSGPRELFGDARLPFDSLPDAIARIELSVDQLRLPGMPPLSALTANLQLDRGALRIEPFALRVAGGPLRGAFTLAAGAAPRVGVQLDASGLSAEELARAAGDDRVGGGRVQVKARLAMRGSTPRALAASANGELLVAVNDATLRSGALAIGPNLLPRLLQILQPQRGAAASTTVECAVARLPLADGVAQIDRSIAAETRELTFSASGWIDLRDQTLELAIRPATRNALAINPAQLASLVVAKGPLLEPRLALDARGAANAALAIGAAAATGGLSALGHNLVRQAADPHPCVFAQTGVAAKDAGAPAPQHGAASAPAAPSVPRPEDVGRLLRRLFK